MRLVELHIDRAYVNSPIVDDVFASRGTVFAKPWGTSQPTRPVHQRRLQDRLCAPRQSPAPPARSSRLSPAIPSSSTPKPAAHAHFERSAHRPRRAAAAPSPSPPTKPGNASTASFSRHARAAPRSAAAPPSNTPSPISPPERDLGLATSASAAICSIYDEPPSSRTSRVSNGWRVPPNHRESQQSHHARRSRRPWRNRSPTFPAKCVRRGGIEPPTWGFSPALPTELPALGRTSRLPAKALSGGP